MLATNFRARGGEIDIVAEQDGTIVFVEVKTRRSTDMVPAEESVGREKQRHIHRVAQQYMIERKLPSLAPVM